MVNFDALMSKANQPVVSEPRALFQTLQTMKTHQYLRDAQGDVLGNWFQRKDERDLGRHW